MQEVIAANGESVAVAGCNDHGQFGPRDLETCRNSQRASMHGVETVDAEIGGCPRRAADPRNDGHLLAGKSEFGERPGDG